MNKKLLLSLLGLIFLSGCNNVTQPTNSFTPTKTPTPTIEEPKCLICRDHPQAEKVELPELEAFTPTTFDSTSIIKLENELCEGVTQTKWSFTKNNGNISSVITTEVDLNLASIAAGTYENQTTPLTLSTVHNHAIYYELYNPNRMVVAATNADYFGNNKPVNAFVKDSQIIKNGHNDNGTYDYKNEQSDLPASMPMLFGVSGNTAQIAPMIQNASVESTVKAKLSYKLELLRDETSSIVTDKIVINKHADKQNINIAYDPNMQVSAYENSIVLKLKKHEFDSTRVHGEVISIETTTSYSSYQITNEEYYIVVPSSLNITDFKEGDILSYYITSPDDTWKYYDTILGCRHALVINGEIPETVSKEYMNGANVSGVPRTSIGVMPNGNVVIFSVEGLRYGKKSTNETDPYGLNLTELAEFMRYYGVYSGANFDGGGSTQLITKNITTGEFEVTVRSSDFGTTVLENSRPVINSILVTKKYE